jgi:hypothetical protein
MGGEMSIDFNKAADTSEFEVVSFKRVDTCNAVVVLKARNRESLLSKAARAKAQEEAIKNGFAVRGFGLDRTPTPVNEAGQTTADLLRGHEKTAGWHCTYEMNSGLGAI